MSDLSVRAERILGLVSSTWVSMNTLARFIGCPEASVRRDIGELRRAGYYVVVSQGQVRCCGRRTALLASQEDEHGAPA